MSIFDQRGQHVGNQYNAAGDINVKFDQVQNRQEFVRELDHLLREFAMASSHNIIPIKQAEIIDINLKEAIVEAQKPHPNKQSLLDKITGAKALIEGVAAAGGLVTTLTTAAEAVQKLF